LKGGCAAGRGCMGHACFVYTVRGG
jgi:hypothetical protein